MTYYSSKYPPHYHHHYPQYGFQTNRYRYPTQQLHLENQRQPDLNVSQSDRYHYIHNQRQHTSRYGQDDHSWSENGPTSTSGQNKFPGSNKWLQKTQEEDQYWSDEWTLSTLGQYEQFWSEEWPKDSGRSQKRTCSTNNSSGYNPASTSCVVNYIGADRSGIKREAEKLLHSCSGYGFEDGNKRYRMDNEVHNIEGSPSQYCSPRFHNEYKIDHRGGVGPGESTARNPNNIFTAVKRKIQQNNPNTENFISFSSQNNSDQSGHSMTNPKLPMTTDLSSSTSRSLHCDLCDYKLPADREIDMRKHLAVMRHFSASLLQENRVGNGLQSAVVRDSYMKNLNARFRNIVPICPECFHIYPTKYMVALHYNIIHDKNVTDCYALANVTQDVQFDVSSRKFVCSKCPGTQKFKHSKDLIGHWDKNKSHLPYPEPQPDCKIIFMCLSCDRGPFHECSQYLSHLWERHTFRKQKKEIACRAIYADKSVMTKKQLPPRIPMIEQEKWQADCDNLRYMTRRAFRCYPQPVHKAIVEATNILEEKLGLEKTYVFQE